ncbi:MAG: sodium:proton antiporter, partial [Gammaproteobacteria bacterium]|nr:sodium:proton antiporter [Gammaproteobacteria bacterium]
MTDTGMICLVPTLVVLVLAVISRRTIEPLIAGSLVGLLILAPSDLLTNFTGVMLSVMGDETIGWIIMVCGLMGSLIALLASIGGAAAFGRLVAARVRTRAGALITAWLLGLAIFIDDYLNALTISSSMKKVTDKFGVSREMLAYVVDSTAAPICVLVPLSTWAVYFAALLEENTGAGTGEGLLLYMQAIPYMFYAWAAVVIVPLVILGKIPHLGAMAKAEDENARKYRMRPMEDQSGLADDADNGNQGRAGLNFFVPILSLIFFTWYLGIDILNGVIV